MIERLLFIAAPLFGVAFCEQPSAPSPVPAPLRELPWAQLNFLHTTDIHGWWSGHLQEASFSADWGDYISFIQHLREKADSDGSDLVIVDTGDRIEGNGLYDSSTPRGKYTFDIFKQNEIDVLCSGNHELYKQTSSEDEYLIDVPNFKGNYLSSNLDIHDPKTGELVPLADRFKKFTTKNQGIRILAFGFIFDFTGNANNTVVQPVEETVKQDWFQEAIRDNEIDLILVIGHVAVRSKEYDIIFNAIRHVNWDIPVQFFGGHYHIRDYKVYDKKSAALASGRYLETIGFMSIDGLSTGKSEAALQTNAKSSLKFARRYIDGNLYSFYHHSGKDNNTFPTERGRTVSKMIASAREALNLDHRFGCVPSDLWMNRVPYPHNSSIFTWLENRVLPEQLGHDDRIKNGTKALAITNTGAIRFDIFAGPFTIDSTYIISPFTSEFRVLKDVPFSAAKQVLKLLNNGPVGLTSAPPTIQSWIPVPSEPLSIPSELLASRQGRFEDIRSESQTPLGDGKDLTPGYTTADDGGSDGDDTIHEPIIFHNVPNCVQASLGFDIAKGSVGDAVVIQGDEPPQVDLVYNAFLQPYILLALEYLNQKYTEADSSPFNGAVTLTSIISDWVKKNWEC